MRRDRPGRSSARRLPFRVTTHRPSTGPTTVWSPSTRPGSLHNFSLSNNRQNLIVGIAGLYLIEYGVRATTGTPGYCTVSFTPGGYDVAGRVPLTANTIGERFDHQPAGRADMGGPARRSHRQQHPRIPPRYARLPQRLPDDHAHRPLPRRLTAATVATGAAGTPRPRFPAAGAGRYGVFSHCQRPLCMIKWKR